MHAVLLYSPSLSGRNPISSYMLMPWILARSSTNGKSKLSPLYVAMTVGFASRMCSNHRRMVPACCQLTYNHQLTSSGSLKIVNSPSYSGFGVYSKSSMSSPTISRLVMRYPCPSIMYEIIMIWSVC